MSEKKTEEEKDRQVEEELQLALTIATRLYKVVSNPEFLKEVPDPRDRHEVVNMQLSKMDEAMGQQMYTQFANAYPVVLKYITQQVSFNRIAFEKFFRAQVANPGKGMEGFIEHQSNYARLLYIEASKAAGKHYSIKKANKLKQREYQQMDKIRKDIEESRKKAENEFEEENTQHMDERKKELLDFINQELEDHGMPGTDEYSGESESSDDEQEIEKSIWMTDDEWWEQATEDERTGKIKTLKFLEGVLINEIEEREQTIVNLKEMQVKKKEVEARKKQERLMSFLPENMKNNKKKKKRKNNRKKR
jgi:hypothetical protein